MQSLAILSLGVFLCLNLLTARPPAVKACLPKGIKPGDVVSTELMVSGGVHKKITVAQKLAALRASCKRGKLVDAAGKEIRFYRLEGCWGNPPEGYQEILRKQSEELAKLRERYTVIEMTCNPEGASPYCRLRNALIKSLVASI